MGESRRTQARATATFTAYFWEAYNEIVQPRRFDHYLLRKWLKDLGPIGFTVVKILRDQCYHNPETGVLRDTCEMSMDELAAAVGVSRAYLFKLFKENTALQQFVQRIEQYEFKNGKPRRAENLYRVCMDDPIHPDDLEEYDRLRALKEQERNGAPPKRIFKGRPDLSSSGSYESTTETHSDSYESTPETADPMGLKSTTTTTDPTGLPSTTATAIDSLPSGGLTKESLTHSAGESPHISPQGEGDTLGQAWAKALPLLIGMVNKPTFESHVRFLRPVSLVETENAEGIVVTLAARSAFSREWMQQRHIGTKQEPGALPLALAEALNRSPDSVTIKITQEDK